MKPPQAFHDFTLQFHQDIDLVHPNWFSDNLTALHDIYNSFRRRYGDDAVRELNAFFDKLLSNEHVDLEEFWAKESKADWFFSSGGTRWFFKDFQAWASSLK